jgi:peroxiredoxin
MNWFALMFIRPLVVVAAAWLILRICRVQHPASQHVVWSAALGGMLVIGPLSFVLPRWNLALLPPRAAPILHSAVAPAVSSAPAPPGPIELAATRAPASRSTPPRPNRLPSPAIPLVLAAYLAGLFAVAGRQFTGRILMLRLVRRSTPLMGRLRESRDVVVPVTAGFWSPKVVLPTGWRQWSKFARRSVLRHEFAHIRRGDLLTSAMADCVRSLLWFHPVAWWLARKVAVLAEMACDASAVEAVASPGDYCRLLLEFTDQVARAGHRATLPGLAIAGNDCLDLRIERVFAASRGGSRKLARPALVLALGMIPALSVAAAVDFSESGTPVWRSAPFRVLMFLQGEHVGKLAPELVPCERMQAEELLPASGAERAAIPTQLAAGDRVFIKTTFFTKDKRLKLALVEPEQGDPYLYADVNLNGLFEPGERFSFTATTSRLLPRYPEVMLRVPYTARPYSIYPIRVMLPETRIYKEAARQGGRMLLRSPFGFVEGTVDIGGQKTLVRFMFDPDKGAAYPDYGWQGMDVNGDGHIQEGANSDEWTFAKDEGVIFHVNGHDVSTVSLDLKSGSFVVREHPTGDNRRIPLHVGEPLPDFPYTDLDGKPHRLSEFHGKYVLLDFWGTWCGPCRRELPDLEKAWQQFRPRGLVVLGMDDDVDTAAARKVLSEAGVTYPQSSGETGNALVHKQFRIDRFPTKALLDPEGKVIALDSDGSFDRDHIASTLDRLLPQAK